MFIAALEYAIKLPRGPRFLTEGWSVGCMFRARTGFPVDVLAAETFDGLNFADVIRPNLVPGQPVWITDPGLPGGRPLNPAAFRAPVNALDGALGRNTIREFGISQLDLSLSSAIPLTDRASLEMHAEAANVLNHLMLGGGTPHSGLTPAFQVGGPRVIQVGLRLRF